MKPRYEVIVAGGGTAGVVAALQAGRAGASTLLIEKSGVLGGTTVLNAVNFPGLFHAWGSQVIAGIGWELVSEAVAVTGDALPDFTAWRRQPHHKLQVRVNRAAYAALADRKMAAAGVTVAFHTMVGEVQSRGAGWALTLCTKEGLRPVEASVLIDCTGDANAVALAGLPLKRNARMQPGTLVVRTAGYDFAALDLPPIEAAFMAAVKAGRLLRSDIIADKNPVAYFLRNRGENSVHIVGHDASTSEGKSAMEVAARGLIWRLQEFFRSQPGLENFHYDFFATECGVRESCTIDGEACVTVADYVSGRHWEDAVCYSFYPIDVHRLDGQGIDIRPLEPGVVPTLPLRALLPKGSRNLLVAGRNACGDQEALSAFRVQASSMAMGQAAGALAALAALRGTEVRQVPLADLHALLQQHQAIVPDATGMPRVANND
jgi:glycine/D-amino acid oxidase-like deaminating enzyme